MAESKTIEIKVKWHKATEAPKKNVPIYIYFSKLANENIRFAD